VDLRPLYQRSRALFSPHAPHVLGGWPSGPCAHRVLPDVGECRRSNAISIALSADLTVPSAESLRVAAGPIVGVTDTDTGGVTKPVPVTEPVGVAEGIRVAECRIDRGGVSNPGSHDLTDTRADALGSGARSRAGA
jgi:hypothetical protein